MVLSQAGCAVVDPNPDYNRTISLISTATGVDSIYRPGDEARVEKAIVEFLDEGLTVDEAVQICLLNNPELQASFHRLGMARADVVQSQLLQNPSVGISTRFPAGGGLLNLEAGFAQNLVDIWQLPIRKRVAERTLNQVILSIAQQASRLASDTKAMYFRAVAATELYMIALVNLEAAERTVQLTITLQQSGAGSGVDVNFSKSAMQEVELLVTQATLEAFNTKSNLARKLGLVMPPAELVLTDALPAMPDHTIEIESILRLAADHRFDLSAANEGLLALADNIGLEKQRVFPRVMLGLEIERESRPRSSDGRFIGQSILSSIAAGGPALAPGFGSKDDESVITVGPTLSLELPIFDQNQAQIAKAHYEYEEAVKQFKSLYVEVSHDVHLAHARAMSAWETARFYQYEFLPLRETTLELARAAYRAGKVSFLIVLEAQRSQQLAKAGLVRALRESALGWVDLERVTTLPMQRIVDSSNESNPSPEINTETTPETPNNP